MPKQFITSKAKKKKLSKTDIFYIQAKSATMTPEELATDLNVSVKTVMSHYVKPEPVEEESAGQKKKDEVNPRLQKAGYAARSDGFVAATENSSEIADKMKKATLGNNPPDPNKVFIMDPSQKII